MYPIPGWISWRNWLYRTGIVPTRSRTLISPGLSAASKWEKGLEINSWPTYGSRCDHPRIRCFEDENILRDEGPINPIAIRDIETELQLKTLKALEKRSVLEKMAKNRSQSKVELEILMKCKEHLDKGKILFRLVCRKKIRTRSQIFLPHR